MVWRGFRGWVGIVVLTVTLFTAVPYLKYRETLKVISLPSNWEPHFRFLEMSAIWS